MFLPLYFQASGEAQYTDDILKQGGELYAAFVTTTQVRISNVIYGIHFDNANSNLHTPS